ncbi:hypothetical protein GCM10008967_15860 [Bacillus carboniphilus]|uniref:Uncharacterized protein n=2 Tax=Bacillus carboniphilus TaxID=86663 RepID=A0ABN0W5Z8_9BACI
MKEMYEGFLLIEKYYYRATGSHIGFVPVYVSKTKRIIIEDNPIFFTDQQDFQTELKIVSKKIQTRLNLLADSLET